MKINLATWDRIIRFILGFLLTTWAIAGGATWGYFGIYLLLSSSFGFCLIYGLLKVKTIHIEERSMLPDDL